MAKDGMTAVVVATHPATYETVVLRRTPTEAAHITEALCAMGYMGVMTVALKYFESPDYCDPWSLLRESGATRYLSKAY